MTTSPEIEKPIQPKEEAVVKEVPDTPEVPVELKEHGVIATPTQITAQVSDNAGAPLMQTPATQVVTITIPANQQQLADWSKGAPEDSLTWFAMFWLRMIRKAIHYGWKVITKGGQQSASNV